MADLEQLLQQQLQEGALHSAGHFTLDREEALRKLTEFQLQVPEWWILKVVQSAQTSGARSIQVRLGATGVQIEWDLQEEAWTLEEVERELWNPETAARRSLDHLKRGLWVVGFRQHYPFQLELPGNSECLLFQGSEIRRCSGSLVSSKMRLNVSHRRANQGFSLLSKLETSNYHDLLSNVLRVRAHACAPVLFLGERRINAIQASPTHGYPADPLVPFWVASAPESEPNLLPPRRMDEFTGSGPHSDVFQLPVNLNHFQQGPAGAICLFAVGAYVMHRDTIPQAHPSPSYLHWLRDGVIVDSQKLPLPDLTVSVSIFASAEGLRSDLSGFGLIDSPERSERVHHLLRLVAPLVQQVRWEVPPGSMTSMPSTLKGGGMLCIMGGMVTFTVPTVGIPMIAGGILLARLGKRMERTFLARAEKDLLELQKQWERLKD